MLVPLIHKIRGKVCVYVYVIRLPERLACTINPNRFGGICTWYQLRTCSKQALNFIGDLITCGLIDQWETIVQTSGVIWWLITAIGSHSTWSHMCYTFWIPQTLVQKQKHPTVTHWKMPQKVAPVAKNCQKALSKGLQKMTPAAKNVIKNGKKSSLMITSTANTCHK